ncbi:MAG: membrane protein DedA with SNARE-associated domain [Gammaproteobacteria bacterium]|jgi:membrane protein DedA with SNARE-associated domain
MQFLIDYGYFVLFLLIFLDQIGLPLPSVPVVLASGALSGMDEMNAYLAVLITVLACLPADSFWYYLGRTKGGKVLSILCSISLEPDHCVRRTEISFERLGFFSIIIAKFIPGLQTIAPPMAGLTQMSVWRFLALDVLGATLWASVLVYVGYLFSNELADIAGRFSELGVIAALMVAGTLILFILAKLTQRQLFLKSLRTRMVEPTEVKDKLDAGDSPFIIDLRHRLDFNAVPHTLPNAHRIPMEHINKFHEEIPRDRDIVLYCS